MRRRDVSGKEEAMRRATAMWVGVMFGEVGLGVAGLELGAWGLGLGFGVWSLGVYMFDNSMNSSMSLCM